MAAVLFLPSPIHYCPGPCSGQPSLTGPRRTRRHRRRRLLWLAPGWDRRFGAPPRLPPAELTRKKKSETRNATTDPNPSTSQVLLGPRGLHHHKLAPSRPTPIKILIALFFSPYHLTGGNGLPAGVCGSWARL